MAAQDKGNHKKKLIDVYINEYEIEWTENTWKYEDMAKNNIFWIVPLLLLHF